MSEVPLYAAGGGAAVALLVLLAVSLPLAFAEGTTLPTRISYRTGTEFRTGTLVL